MNELHGWWLPDSDNYFAKFVTQPGKSSGFQVDHLDEALKHVTGWGVALDIGAHCGFWTLPMAERFEAVHAFEVAPDTFACLKRNCEGLPNVTVSHAGVGERSGACSVREDEKRHGNTGSRFVGRGGQVRMVAIDDFDWAACDFMKIDVEGYEAMVLRGAAKTIAKFRPVIIMETDKKFARSRYGINDDAAERFLIEMGYRVAAHMRPDKVFVP